MSKTLVDGSSFQSPQLAYPGVNPSSYTRTRVRAFKAIVFVACCTTVETSDYEWGQGREKELLTVSAIVSLNLTSGMWKWGR